jgi:hypothetical protein
MCGRWVVYFMSGRKAFAGDYAVREYSASSELVDIPVISSVLGNISSWQAALKIILHKTLDKIPSKRRTARELKLHLTALTFISPMMENLLSTHNGVHESFGNGNLRSGMIAPHFRKS